jgi:peptidoglycan hydrolase-like protein with peptidoglycan-binding domain
MVEGDSGGLVIGIQVYTNTIEGCGGAADDGDFGPATLKAVKCMQTRIGVTVDGSVGPITWGAMGLSKTSTSGGWVYYGANPGAKEFRESTSTGVWDCSDPYNGSWVAM